MGTHFIPATGVLVVTLDPCHSGYHLLARCIHNPKWAGGATTYLHGKFQSAFYWG